MLSVFSALKRMVHQIKSLLRVADLSRFFMAALALGVLSFICELAIIECMSQILADNSQSIGLSFLPNIQSFNFFELVVVLIGFGCLRQVLAKINHLLSLKADFLFNQQARGKLIKVSLLSETRLDTSKALYYMNEVIVQNGFMVSAICSILFLVGSLVFLVGAGLKLAFFEFSILFVLFGSLMVVWHSTIGRESFNKLNSEVSKKYKKINDGFTYGLNNKVFLKSTGLMRDSISETLKAINLYKKEYDSLALKISIQGIAPILIGVVCIFVSIRISDWYFDLSSDKILAFLYLSVRINQGLSGINSLFSHLDYNSHGLGGFIQFVENPIKEEPKRYSSTSLCEDIESIRFEDVELGYQLDTPLVTRLSFAVQKGDLLLIKGKSGSGKSTLLQTILGIHQPQAGAIFINKQNGFPQNFNEKVGYVGPIDSFFAGSLRENLHPFSSEPPEASVEKIFDDLGISSLLPRLDESVVAFPDLSSGQMRRLQLARAILRRPKLLVMDEVSANLDEDSAVKISEVIKILRKDMIVVVTSHQNHFDEVATLTLCFSDELNSSVLVEGVNP